MLTAISKQQNLKSSTETKTMPGYFTNEPWLSWVSVLLMKTSSFSLPSLKLGIMNMREPRYSINTLLIIYQKIGLTDFTSNSWNLRNSMAVARRWRMLSSPSAGISSNKRFSSSSRIVAPARKYTTTICGLTTPDWRSKVEAVSREQGKFMKGRFKMCLLFLRKGIGRDMFIFGLTTLCLKNSKRGAQTVRLQSMRNCYSS